MLDESTSHLREIIDDASKLMSGYFKKQVNFSKVIQLSEPDRRNMLLRLLIKNPQKGMPKTIILKQTATEGNKFDSSAKSETEIEKFSRFAHEIRVKKRYLFCLLFFQFVLYFFFQFVKRFNDFL